MKNLQKNKYMQMNENSLYSKEIIIEFNIFMKRKCKQ